MKLLLPFALLAAIPFAHAQEILKIPLSDGEQMEGRLVLPAPNAPKAIVVYIHGTGPATYLNKRKAGEKEFQFFDPFAEVFSKKGVGLFTYNKRGVTLADTPPTYEAVDRSKFALATPSREVEDVKAAIKALRLKHPQAKIVLFGWSEGTVLATMVAEEKSVGVDALLLAGYANENMYDLIKWQFSGESSITNLAPYFDPDGNRSISKAEYETEEESAKRFRTGALRDAKFEQLDVNKDGSITSADFGTIAAPMYKAVLDAYSRGDEDWIWKNYFRVSLPWLKEHFALEANKSRMLRLEQPIFIFQGRMDASCPVEGVMDVQRRFEVLGKKNLTVQVFDGHNHDLDYQDWITKGELSPGIKAIFAALDQI